MVIGIDFEGWRGIEPLKPVPPLIKINAVGKFWTLPTLYRTNPELHVFIQLSNNLCSVVLPSLTAPKVKGL